MVVAAVVIGRAHIVSTAKKSAGEEPSELVGALG
jgi:hypothetical protein